MFLKFYLEKTMVKRKKKFNIKWFFRPVSATVCRFTPGKFFFSSIVRSSFNNATQIDGISGKKFAGNEMKNAEGDRKSGSKRLVQKKNRKIRDKIYLVTREDTLECTQECSRQQNFQDLANHLLPMDFS